MSASELAHPVRAPNRALRRALAFALLSLLTVLWCVVMLRVGAHDMYLVVGSYALITGALVAALYRRALGDWFRPRARDVAIGVGVGAAMTALTYPVYRLAVALVPSLEPAVSGLYRTSHKGHWLSALGWVVVIILAEELLFRGAWLSLLSERLGQRAALGVSVVLYAGAQAFSGSLIVGVLAFCCGMVWSVERLWTGSLLAPLTSHLIWTPTTILLHPVIS